MGGFHGLGQLVYMVCRKVFLLVGILAMILSLSIVNSWSHPHVFVYSAVDVVFDENGLAGFRIRWLFDEMFSSMIILDFDKNGNNRFEPSEIENVEDGAFSNLCEFDYFMHIKINGEPFTVKFVTDFSAEIKKGRLIYQFFVPCHVRAIDAFKELKLSIYDSTFYSSFFLVKNPVAFENHQTVDVDHRIEKNKEDAYYFDQIYPEEITLKFRRKNE